MAGELAHEGTDGSTTLSRVDLAQYDGVPAHELLAGDFTEPQEVLDAWLSSETECNALFGSRVDELGIGHGQSQDGGATAWVLVLGEFRGE